ncbi:MAG: HAD family hydrolase [Lachnospiraceae bacterium]|nr:HAD hydrolase-like protein [Candidatus Fimimorpha excrementavium]
MKETWGSFTKEKDFLVCVDSDGCAMDTMDIKHIKCFGPCMVEEWGLEEWKEPILKRWNEINLYQKTRGINRFKALALILTEIDHNYVRVEDLDSLVYWADHAKELSNQSVETEAERLDSVSLRKALAWSKAVNSRIKELPEEGKKPFEGVKEALEEIHKYADIAIVSSANRQAVLDEWEKEHILEYTDVVMAQDCGSKAHCIEMLKKEGYKENHILMVGDAPGDLQAARVNQVMFYPILVKKEKESWDELRTQGLDAFLNERYQGEYEQEKEDAFNKNLSV